MQYFANLVLTNMDPIGYYHTRILEKDPAAMQSELERPAEVFKNSSKILILPLKHVLVSITAESMDSQRQILEAPSLAASGDVKGAFLTPRE